MSKPPAKSKTDKFMGLQLGASDDDSDSSSTVSEEEEEKEQSVPRKKIALSVEDLERAGYKSGPSVLFVKPPAEQEPQNWNWSNGRAAKGREEDDDGEDRLATQEALTTSLEESAKHSVKAMQLAAKLREDAKQERLYAKQERITKEKALTFNQKEKRKRDTGQSSRAKNYVEESKRAARAFGVYSGFD